MCSLDSESIFPGLLIYSKFLKTPEIMQIKLLLLCLFSASSLTAQVETLEIIKTIDDTLFKKKTIRTLNDVVQAIHYYKDSSKAEGLTKEDLFILGDRRPFYQFDSTRVFTYDKNWNLIKSELFIETEPVKTIPYKLEEFEVLDSPEFITGETFSKKTVSVQIRSCSARNLELNVSLIGGAVEQKRVETLKSKEIKTIDFEVELLSGEQDFYLVFENPGIHKEKLKLSGVGYDVTDSDFVGKDELAILPKYTFSKVDEINIEIIGNQKLLYLCTQNERKAISVSGLLNTLELNSLKEGIYTLELVNLGTRGKSYCKIEIEG